MILTRDGFVKMQINQKTINKMRSDKNDLSQMKKNCSDTISFSSNIQNQRRERLFKEFLETGGEPTKIGGCFAEEGIAMKAVMIPGSKATAEIWWDNSSPLDSPRFLIKCAEGEWIKVNDVVIKHVHSLFETENCQIEIKAGDVIDLNGAEVVFYPPEKIKPSRTADLLKDFM